MAKNTAPSSSSTASSTRQSGIIVAAYGRHYDVAVSPPPGRVADGGGLSPSPALLKCHPRGKKSIYACGDEVEIENSAPGQGVIVHQAPRRNLLWRSDAFREKLIAANLTQIVIVVATEPSFSDLLISRCIAAAENQQIKTLILLNKSDLGDKLPAARALLAPYTALDYRCVELSALHDNAQLAALLQGEKSIFVGQSGMGKSTLTNALIPDAQAATREISAALDTGKHTTTFAKLYAIDDGWLIDSPGLQAFGLAHIDVAGLEESFREFRPHLGQCRFRDCQHEAEPGCALLAALAEGRIQPRRMEHFKLIRDEIRSARKQARGW